MIPENLEKATLSEISWDTHQNTVDGDHSIEVQFNPESLKIALSNQNSGGDQRGGSAIQYVGAGTSKLSFDLWFDSTGAPGQDVRDLTNEVVFFMTATQSREGSFFPPGVRFLWGSFLFEGVMDSLNEDLEYFSEDGRPLRAKLAISISRQEIRYEQGRQQGGSGLSTNASSGANQQAQEGDSVPQLAGKNWPKVAAANGIENPLNLAAGTILDLNAGLSVSAGAGLSLGGGLSAGASFSAGFSAGASLGGGLRAGIAGGAGIGGGLSGNLGAGGGLSGGLSGGASLTGGVNAGLSGGTLAANGRTSGGLGGAALTAQATASASFDQKLRR